MTNELFYPGENLQNNVADITNVATLPGSGVGSGDAYDPQGPAIEKASKIIEDALHACSDDPGVLMSDDFLKAYGFIKQNDKTLATNFRVRIKREKPNGVLMSEIDKLSESSESGSHGDNVASELIEIANELGKLFYDEKTERAFLTADIEGTQFTMATNAKQFTEWVSYQYYASTGQSANESSIKQAKLALAGIAKYEGKRSRVHLRVADHHDGHYIFLADERLRAVEVRSTGWRIIEHPPVKFWKPAAMQSLPMPEPGGNIDLMWDFINVKVEDRPLVLAWMLESFRSETPKPVLSLCGTQGSAKSSTQNKIRQFIDNNSVNLRAAPKSVQDIYVGAGCNWVISYENLSHLSAQVQDAICTLATGGGFAARTLYSDDEETVIDAKRPVIINSIPNVITAQDLTDRAVCIELPRVSYKEEMELEKEWQEAMPSIFGGLLDLFVNTLEKLPSVKISNPPRMADFARLGGAMMQAQGHESGEFTELYRDNLNEGIGRSMESSPAAIALREMSQRYPEGSTVFHGTVQGLLQRLVDYRHDSENWPRSARGLADVLRRQTPGLSLLGISVVIGTRVQRMDGERGIPITVTNSVNDASPRWENC